MPSNQKRAAQSRTTISKPPTTTNTSKSISPRLSPPVASSNDTAGAAKQNNGSNAASLTNSNSDTTANHAVANHVAPTSTPGVNRKKQKRRQKQAARLAAEQQLKDEHPPAGTNSQNGYTRNTQWGDPDVPLHSNQYSSSPLNQNYFGSHVGDPNHYDPAQNDDLYSTDDDGHLYAQRHSQTHPDRRSMDQHSEASGSKSKKKKSKKHRFTSLAADGSSTSVSTQRTSTTRPAAPPPPPLSNAALRSAHKISKDRIWNTSTQEERENIKEFWLQLGEEERRSLVKVEKEAVLRKMKEQQKHSCSCTVCGRKRTAIEEELEVLYDAYYEELEQYANHSQSSFENGGPIVPPRLYQPPLRSLDRHPHLANSQLPPRGRVQELPDDDDLEEDYDEDDEEDEPYSDDELEEAARSSGADFFAFGNSLTVKDGILTVADDLLKNDGKHFIDMMEQLAERRMQREEDTQYATASAAHQSLHAGHNHGPPLDEEDYEDEEDDDYDSQDDEDYEEDEMDAMTEEQRMEEGRRMFQIFAARMFEQRVLTAYREKVARERQLKLIEELEEENRLDVQREAKKAREAQKRKDKKKQQKQAKEEEKARKEAEKAAEAAAAKAIEEKKKEEQRRKKEEQRKKREAEKKAQEEERLRKEAEKQKRLQEERERQAEIERKQREQKEREKKKREEAKKKEREEREAKEKELREKKAKEEQERKAREQAKLEKEAALKTERESKERAKREEQAAQAAQAATAQAAKRISQSGPTYLPPGLQPQHGQSALQSPHFQVATPVVPKAPTPVRPRQTSQHGSHASSPRSQPAGTDTSHTSVSPGNAGVSQSSGSSSSVSAKSFGPTPMLHHPQPSAPMSPLGGAARSPHSVGFSSMPTLNGVPSSLPGLPGMTSRIPLGHEMPMYPSQQVPLGGQFRGFPSPDGIPMAPGLNGTRPIIPSRGFPLDTGHGLPFHSQLLGPSPISSSSSQQPQIPRETRRGQTHSRQASSSFERSSLENKPQNLPISRPAPIQRPASTTPHNASRNETKPELSDIDDLSAQLGSSALLDETDVPFTSSLTQPIPTSSLPGAPGAGRMVFGTSPLFTESLGSKHPNFPLGPAGSGNTWGSQTPFGGPGFPATTSWGSVPSSGSGWSNNAFGIIGGTRPHTSRPVTVRLLVAQACKQLNATSPTKGNSGFHSVNHVLRQVEQLNPPNEPQITLDELLDICDTEGNPQNGGGSFVIKNETRGTFVKFEPDSNSTSSGPRGSVAPGDIGSPATSISTPAFGGVGATGGSRQFPAPPNISPPTGF
ncbi:stress response protein nst1 [Histoplasma ohiense]|nr:stress response protein nst1 [Histoplasma ohiense (nom. inval.)]